MSEPGRKGEPRWPTTLAVLCIIVLPFLIPYRLGFGWTRWLFTAAEIVLVIAVTVADPGIIDRRTDLTRGLAIALISVLVATSLYATARLVYEIVQAAPPLQNATTLLVTGGLIWLDTVITFSLLYWELDSGGPATRFLDPRPFPDLAFPQHMNPEVRAPGWRPLYLDYLYLGVTNALAFSPTDVMPLARWAKVVMGLQSLISVAILGLVIANAVNILK